MLDEIAPPGLYGIRLDLDAHNWGGRSATWFNDDMRSWQQAMAERGWTAPTWPAEYGGAGWSAEQASVLSDELRRRRLPPPLVGIGLAVAGPVLLRFGSEEQKRRHLPAIARGEARWCQGFSEPEAGSDLPNLKTRAEQQGDSYVVRGQKVWTSHAHLSDWMLALVHTGAQAAKRLGITSLLIDMTSPGITTRPIRLISGASPFCETFFDDVEVPAGNVVGAVNGGWEVARFVFRCERDMLGAIVVGDQKAEPLASFARRYLPSEDGRIVDTEMRRAIAQSEMDSRAYEFLAAGKAARTVDANLLKLYSSELNQRRLDLRQDIAGLAATALDGPGAKDDEVRLARTWLRSRAYSIEGGTSEIMLNTISRRTLGLPTGSGDQ
ncbi:MAG: acyl-CoA dehydrogenase family protein [Actinomycetota bacterium]